MTQTLIYKHNINNTKQRQNLTNWELYASSYMLLICTIIHPKPFKRLIAKVHKVAFLDIQNTLSSVVDCAGIVLNCLFCQFYDMILQLPASCKKIVNQCCPNYQQVTPTAQSPVSEESSYTDWDCGLLASCKDANECLELAMEVSEMCYH
uniref:MyoD family inhibitor domain containing 2 n=1 Tax=Periophthalmus magnuspinnatus TaxID=409849 RepID=A0A3B4A224_9GOBI